jgi:hypothetical protein
MERYKSKRVELVAETFEKAKEIVLNKYDGWRISMFWYVWPNKENV